MGKLIFLVFIFCLIYGGYLLVMTISNYLLNREETDAVSNGKTVVAVVWTILFMPIASLFFLFIWACDLFLGTFFLHPLIDIPVPLILAGITYLLMKYWFP